VSVLLIEWRHIADFTRDVALQYVKRGYPPLDIPSQLADVVPAHGLHSRPAVHVISMSC
jgi:hypothetical protein